MIWNGCLSSARFSKNDELLAELEYDPSRVNEWNEVLRYWR